MFVGMAAHERNIQASIIRVLTEAGAWYTKIHQEGHGRKGIPDLIACYRGVFLGIEVKTPDGRPTGPQVVELNGIRDAGGIGIIARSADDVREYLGEIDQWYPCEGVRPIAEFTEQPPLPKLRRVSL